MVVVVCMVGRLKIRWNWFHVVYVHKKTIMCIGSCNVTMAGRRSREDVRVQPCVMMACHI